MTAEDRRRRCALRRAGIGAEVFLADQNSSSPFMESDVTGVGTKRDTASALLPMRWSASHDDPDLLCSRLRKLQLTAFCLYVQQ